MLDIIYAWNAIFHLFLRLKGAIGSIFQAFSAENPKKFNFSAEFQMPWNDVQMRQIDSKTLFWDSRSPADAFLYLGGAPMTNIGA